MLKRLFAEFIGTFWLVLGGCGDVCTCNTCKICIIQ